MKRLLLFLLSIPALLNAQSHVRYEISIPANITPPYVAEILVPAGGKVVAISSGGNVDRANVRVSWGAVVDATPTIWLEMVFPNGGILPIPVDLTVTLPDGSTRSLAPAATPVPNSVLALLAGEDTPLDLSLDQDEDGLSFIMEHMLHLSDEEKNDAMKAFTTTEEAGGVKLTAPLRLPDGYDLLIRPALRTGMQLPAVMLASENKSLDGNRIEISNLPGTFLFTVSVISPAE